MTQKMPFQHCKSRRRQVRGNGEYIGTTSLPCSSNREHTLGSCPTCLKSLVKSLDFYNSPFQKVKMHCLLNFQLPSRNFFFERRLSAHVLYFKGLRKYMFVLPLGLIRTGVNAIIFIFLTGNRRWGIISKVTLNIFWAAIRLYSCFHPLSLT